MIDKETLGMLVCPQDRTPLELAERELVDRLNRAIAAGKVKNRGGQLVEKPVDGALVRQDRSVLYPILDDIPVLLIDDAIGMNQVE